MSDSDREWIAAAWPELSASKIAARIGFSKTAVINYLKRAGLWQEREQGGNFEPATLAAEDDRQDTLGRMRELRDSLKVALVDCDSKELPALAREYRATLDEIRRLEAAERGEADDPLAELAAHFAAKLSA